MNVCILSVTRHGEYFSIAGISTKGEWVRLISDGPTAPFWDDTHLRFDTGYGFIQSGDIIEFQEKKPQHAHDNEDYIVVTGNMTLKKRLANDKLFWFLEGAVESQEEFEDTVHHRGRSLCVVQADRMRHYQSEGNGMTSVAKMEWMNEAFNLTRDLTVTDIKWVKLIQQDLIGSHVHFKQIYLVIGLEAGEPHIIGVHTDPQMDLPNTYPY